jgi:hypothetical protein
MRYGPIGSRQYCTVTGVHWRRPMAKRCRKPESELRRQCIKRAFEVLYSWGEEGFPERKWVLVKASIHYLKKQGKIREGADGKLETVQDS